MGIQRERVKFEQSIPSNDVILRRIFESTGLKVRLSISTFISEQEAGELTKKAGLRDFVKREIVAYLLDHPDYRGVIFMLVEENGKKYIEFETGAGFFQKKRTLMDILREALVSLGGEKVD